MIILKPIKTLISTLAASHSFSRIISYNKFEPLKGLVKRIQPLPSSNWNLYRNRYCFISRSKFAWGSVLGASVITGTFCVRPHVAHARNGFNSLEDDHCLDLSDDESRIILLATFRKVLLHILLFLTVLTNWYHPAILAVKVVIILIGTKPTPLSIYIFLEQMLRRQRMLQPMRFKSVYANKVEVEDYALMCLARVELEDQKLTVVGIMGTWWVFPPSTHGDPFTFKDRVRIRRDFVQLEVEGKRKACFVCPFSGTVI